MGDFYQNGIITTLHNLVRRPVEDIEAAGDAETRLGNMLGRLTLTVLRKRGDNKGLACEKDPDNAKCDGPCALPLDRLEPFLAQLKAIDDLVKGFAPLEIS